ncbi:MAG: hypothetical protein MJ246_04620 [Clostridia bacterium]|nr:hypothetical protein [Clostridia bacterium]
MKKFLAVALICALAVSYAACTTNTESAVSENEKDDFVTEDTLGNWMAKSDNYSRDVVEAIEILSSFSAEELGLPTDFKDYSLMPDETYFNYEGDDYVAISAFSDLGDRMYNNGVFYVRVSDKVAFKNDYLTGNMIALNSNEVIINE